MFLPDYIKHTNNINKVWLSKRGIYTYNLNAMQPEPNMAIMCQNNTYKVMRWKGDVAIYLLCDMDQASNHILVNKSGSLYTLIANNTSYDDDDYDYTVICKMLYKIPKNNHVMLRDTSLHNVDVSIAFIASVRFAINRDIQYEIICNLLNLCRYDFNNYVNLAKLKR